MINRSILVGRLTKDPELKYTQSGVAITRFTLAVNRTFTNQNGERDADFINIVTFRKTAENVANYLKKGSLAGVDGRIQTSNFEGQDGKRVFMTEVVADSVQFLEPRNAQDNRTTIPGPNTPGPGQNAAHGNQGNQGGPVDPWAHENNGPVNVTDDDLPF